jgi:hypothetical protein
MVFHRAIEPWVPCKPRTYQDVVVVDRQQDPPEGSVSRGSDLVIQRGCGVADAKEKKENNLGTLTLGGVDYPG